MADSQSLRLNSYSFLRTAIPPVVIASIRQIPSALLRSSRTVIISDVHLLWTDSRTITSHRPPPTFRGIGRSAYAQSREPRCRCGTNPPGRRQNSLSSWILSAFRSDGFSHILIAEISMICPDKCSTPQCPQK